MPRVLSSDQVESYRRDGFVVVPDAVDPAQCDALREAANAIVDRFEPTEQHTVFTTDEQDRSSNDEFLDSAEKIWCFFEADAFDEHGELRRAKALSINKIGHAQHDLDPTFQRFTYTEHLAGVAADAGLERAIALQSMYIFKQPHIGGEVGCHQDSTFLYTDPMTVTGLWFAIEDATLDNGCLWAAPGGHRGPLRKQFRRKGSSHDGTEFVTLDDTPLPEAPGELVPLEVRKGSLVLLHGLLPHWSDVNRSPRSRHAYTVHCIDERAEYPAWNWLQRSAALPFRRLDQAAA